MNRRIPWLNAGAGVAVVVAAGLAIASGAEESRPPVTSGPLASTSAGAPPPALSGPSAANSQVRASSAGEVGAPTVGHVRGTTCGGMALPTPRVGVSTFGTGPLLTDDEAVAVAKKNDPALQRACFSGDAATSTVATLEVAPSGAVVDAFVTAATPSVAACVKGALRRWKFPKRGAPARIQLAFHGEFDDADR